MSEMDNQAASSNLNKGPRKRLVVLISGYGSNFKAILDAIHNQEIHAKIVAVISDNARARGLDYARRHNIETRELEYKDFNTRAEFERSLGDSLLSFAPELIVLAGFMRILSAELTARFAGRIMNIHPALLPKYKGLHTHKRVLESGDTRHGCSTHFVTAQLDAGPIIMQAEVGVEDTDTDTSLAAKVLEQEHIIYSQSIALYCEDRLRMVDNHCILDGEVLQEPLRLV